MGKGDKKTKRGKIFLGSFGKLRPRGEKSDIPQKTVKDNKPKEK